MKISYRPALPEDETFLYILHRETMRAYVEATWGAWDEDWQQAHFHNRFSQQDWTVIQVDGQDVGVLSIETRTEELFLSLLEIHPDYQRQGIGTAVMRDIIRSAAQTGKPVALKVLKVNLSARDLYQRLGFGVTGESDIHYLMAKETSPE